MISPRAVRASAVASAELAALALSCQSLSASTAWPQACWRALQAAVSLPYSLRIWKAMAASPRPAVSF